MNREAFEAAIGRRVEGRRAFADSLEQALEQRRGWASGRFGNSERRYLQYPLVAAAERDPLRLRAFQTHVAFQGLHICGVFPGDPAFLARWSQAYLDAARQLDWIGIFAKQSLPQAAALVAAHSLGSARVIDHREMHYDRSIPADDAGCWLPRLAGRRILLVCPFASVLAARADRETFEAVWAKTGRRWFAPAAVEAVDFPYGVEPATHRRYPDAIALEHEIEAKMDAHDYDVAMIAAGGLGIPLAAHAKRQGRVGISMGGPLQVLFGVHGERWLAMADWRERYINDTWIRVPERLAPSDAAQEPVRARLTAETYW